MNRTVSESKEFFNEKGIGDSLLRFLDCTRPDLLEVAGLNVDIYTKQFQKLANALKEKQPKRNDVALLHDNLERSWRS